MLVSIIYDGTYDSIITNYYAFILSACPLIYADNFIINWMYLCFYFGFCFTYRVCQARAHQASSEKYEKKYIKP